MDWLEHTLDALEKQPVIGYGGETAPATEPTAIAALALKAQGRADAARRVAGILAGWQQANGVVGVRPNEPAPGWPTSLAVLAWCACDAAEQADRIDRGLAWLLANRGQKVPRSVDFGHNSELVGWAFAEHTHSWIEPTSFSVLALKASGRADDPAAREGVAVLVDRQLPGGGLNYGNTFVLGQRLRPHVQPTGIALLALAGEVDSSNRLAKSISWLARSIGRETTPLSLGWAVLGLKAHGAAPGEADEWLAAAAEIAGAGNVPATYKLALLALAAKGWPA